MLSALYMASAVLKRFHSDGEPEADLPLVEWSCQQLLHECEEAMQGVLVNFPARWARITLHLILKPFGRYRNKPNDRLGHQLAKMLIEPGESRSRLTRLVYSKPGDNCPLGRLETAFHKICAIEELEKRLQKAVKEQLIQGLTLSELITAAQGAGIINAEETAQLRDAEAARQEVIKVDDFADEELRRSTQNLKKCPRQM